MILPVSLRDLHAIHLLEREVFRLDAYPHFDLFILLITPGVINLKAVDDSGRLIGFVSGAKAWLPGRPAWIITLCVAANQQNKGIGRKLLLACEERMGSPRVRLTVRAGNASAIHLYETSGYQHIATNWRYYRDGEDGLVMEKAVQN